MKNVLSNLFHLLGIILILLLLWIILEVTVSCPRCGTRFPLCKMQGTSSRRAARLGCFGGMVMGKLIKGITIPCRLRLSSTSHGYCYDEGHVRWTLNPKYRAAAVSAFGDTGEDAIVEECDDWFKQYETTFLMTNADQLLAFVAEVGCECVVSVESGVLQVEVYDDYRE